MITVSLLVFSLPLPYFTLLLSLIHNGGRINGNKANEARQDVDDNDNDNDDDDINNNQQAIIHIIIYIVIHFPYKFKLISLSLCIQGASQQSILVLNNRNLSF